VALSWLEDPGLSGPTLDNARAYLRTLPSDSLVELLVEQAHEDERLARKPLLLSARPGRDAAVDVVSLRALIDQAFAYHGFVPYREVGGYVQGIQETIDELDELLVQGRAAEVIGLAEYTLTAFEQALEQIDDSQNCEVRTFAGDSWWLREVGSGVGERLNDGFPEQAARHLSGMTHRVVSSIVSLGESE